MDQRFNGLDFIQLSNSLHQHLQHQQQHAPPLHHQYHHIHQLQQLQLQPSLTVNNNVHIQNDIPIEQNGLPLPGFPCVTESDEICFIKLFLEHFNTSMPFLTREILQRGKESNLKYFAVDDGVNIENSDIASSFSITWSVCAFGASMKCDTRTLLYLDYARFFLQYCFDTPCILSTVAMLAYEYATFIVSLRDPNINNTIDVQRNHVHRMKKKLYLGFGSVILESNELTEAILDMNALYLHNVLCLKYELYSMNTVKLKAAIESCEESYKKNFPINLKISLYSHICYSKWCLSTYLKKQNSPENAYADIDHENQLISDKFHLDTLISNDKNVVASDLWLDAYGFSLAKDHSSPLILQASMARHYLHMENIDEAKPFARNIAKAIIERNILICTPIIWDVCYFTASILYHSVMLDANSNDTEYMTNECLNDEFYCSQLGFNLFQTYHLCEPLRESGWRDSYGDYKRNAFELARLRTEGQNDTSGEVVKRKKENHESEDWAIILDLRLNAYL